MHVTVQANYACLLYFVCIVMLVWFNWCCLRKMFKTSSASWHYSGSGTQERNWSGFKHNTVSIRWPRVVRVCILFIYLLWKSYITVQHTIWYSNLLESLFHGFFSSSKFDFFCFGSYYYQLNNLLTRTCLILSLSQLGRLTAIFGVYKLTKFTYSLSTLCAASKCLWTVGKTYNVSRIWCQKTQKGCKA